MENHLKTHEKDAEFDDAPHTIQYNPDAEFKEASSNPNLQSKAWVYYLYNERTNEVKCRFCGQLTLLQGKKGKYLLYEHDLSIKYYTYHIQVLSQTIL